MKYKTINRAKYIAEFGVDVQDWGIGISVAKSAVTNGKFYIYLQILCFIFRIEFV